MGAREVDVPTLLGELRGIAGAGGRGAPVAFDFDGTLIDGDAGLAFFESLLARRALLPVVAPRLAEELRGCGADDRIADDPHPMARALLDLYFAGHYPELAVCELMAYATAGTTAAETRALAEASFDASSFYAGAEELVRSTAAAGFDVWIVSGSPRAVIDVAADKLGVPGTRVLAMTPGVDAAGRIEPRVVPPQTYRAGKVAALEAAGVREIAVAFGDTRKDIEMLERAQMRVAVCPRPALLRIAQGESWRVLRFTRTVGGRPVAPIDDDRVFSRGI